MSEKQLDSKDRRRSAAERFARHIARREALKIRAQRQADHVVWLGLGVFGVVGWSVAIPALAGVALGIWIDRIWPSRFSWTLMLLIGGVMLGCINAWYWVKKAGMSKDE